MSTSKDVQPGNPQPIERTGFRWSAWLVFVLVTAVVLAADLGLKYWSFEHVAEVPVHVRTAEAGGPEVLVRLPGGDAWHSAYDLGLTEDAAYVPRHEPTVLVPAVLNLQLTLNQGAVFGLGQGARPIFIVVSVLAAILIPVFIYRSPKGAWLYQTGLALILAGDLGNLYDRVFYSAVRDMLHMLPSLGLWPWIFNLADVALMVGVGLILVISWYSEMKQAKAKKQAATQ